MISLSEIVGGFTFKHRDFCICCGVVVGLSPDAELFTCCLGCSDEYTEVQEEMEAVVTVTAVCGCAK